MYEVRYDVYVHIRGAVEMEEELQYDGDLLDYIFPDGWEGEIDDITTCPHYPTEGYIEITNLDEDNSEEED
jgi:hypothetical protein